MNLTTLMQRDTLIVTPETDRIDAASAIAFKDGVRNLTLDHSGRVVLDLRQVDFIDSSGLGAVVAVMKQMGPTQQLELACLSDGVDKVFRMTRMDSIFPIYATLDDALALRVC